MIPVPALAMIHQMMKIYFSKTKSINKKKFKKIVEKEDLLPE